MRTSAFRHTAVRSLVLGLGLLALGSGVGSASAGASTDMPTSAAYGRVADGPAVVPQAAPTAASAVREVGRPPTIERRREQYEVVNRGGNIARGSVTVQYGIEWIHADVPCCLQEVPGPYRVRGYAFIGENHLVRSMRIDSMVLGSEQRVLGSARATPSSGTSKFLTRATPWSDDPQSAQHTYRVRVTFSIRWTDGTLTKFTRTSPLTVNGQ